MKNIKARFEQSKKTKYRDYAGDYINLAYAVMHQGFNRTSLIRLFKIMVPKDQYLASEKKRLISHLEFITNIPDGVEIQGKNADTGTSIS